MKRLLSLVPTLGLVILFSISSAQAVTIGFDPVSQDVPVGASVDVEVVISGLGHFASPSLGLFDLDILFNPTILSYSGVTFGDPVLGDQLDLSGSGSFGFDWIVGPGTLGIFELSLDLPEDLDALQAGSFTLATLTFDTLNIGTSPLGILIYELSDSSGDPLTASVNTGSVNVVSTVPEPGTLLLFGSGLVGLAGLRRRFKVGS